MGLTVVESDTLYAGLVNPMSPPPFKQVIGEIEFGRESKGESSKCNVLAAAALTPGIPNHAKIVDIYQLHFLVAHAHASVIKIQHGIR